MRFSIPFALALLAACAFAADEKGRVFAAIAAPVANGWSPADRWQDDTIEGTAVVRMTPKHSCYAGAKISGELPKEGMVLVSLHYYSAGGDSFNVGIGGWGSATVEIIPQKTGWQDSAVAFSSGLLPIYANGGNVSLLFNMTTDKSVGIASLAISAPTKDEVLAAYKAYVKSSTDLAWEMTKGREEVLEYDDKEPLNPSDEDSKRGAIPFLRSYLQFVFPKSVPTAAERIVAGGIRIPPGETAPYQFALKALKDLPECTIEAVGELPKGISADVRWLEPVPVRWGGGSRSNKWQVHPNRLWPKNVFPTCAVKSGDATSWWALLSVAEGAEAKVHALKFAAKNGKDTVATFTLNLEVLPFKLPKDCGHSFMLTEGFFIEDDDILADLGKHGINAASSFNNFQPFNGKTADFTLWDRYFERLRKAGMDHAFFWYLGNPNSKNSVMDGTGKEEFVKILQGLNDRVKDGRYPKLFGVSIDEAVSGDALKALQELHDLMKEHSPLLKCFTASMGEVRHAESAKNAIDLLATNGDYHDSKLWSDKNDKIFTTYTSSVSSHPATLSRLGFGLNPWMDDAVVTHGWALRWCNGNPMNDLDSFATDWCTILPNWTGAPLSTPVYEGLREGINDQRYFTYYAQLVKDGKADGALLKQLKEKGVEGIALLPEKTVGDTVFGASIKNVGAIEIARDRVVDEIVKALKKK